MATKLDCAELCLLKNVASRYQNQSDYKRRHTETLLRMHAINSVSISIMGTAEMEKNLIDIYNFFCCDMTNEHVYSHIHCRLH